MTVLDYALFPGVAPSVSARGLGANFAQDNTNLLLRSGEFWPLANDRQHSTCPANTRTLHRLQRDASGNLQQNPSTAIRAYSSALSFVKGQINDERTERTYYTYDDGSQRPRVLDVNGQDRLLGVPRPVRPALAVQVVDEFTQDEAQTWFYGTFAQAVANALTANTISGGKSEPNARFQPNGEIVAGPHSKAGLSFYSQVSGAGSTLAPYNLYAIVSQTRATQAALDLSRLGAIQIPSGYAVPLHALPAGVVLDRARFEQAISLIQYPEYAGTSSGRTVLTSTQVGQVAEKIMSALSAGVMVDGDRTELTKLVQEFDGLVQNKVVTQVGSAPVKPEKPRTPQYINEGESGTVRLTPEWVAYEQALERYNTALTTYQNAQLQYNVDSSALNARLMEIQSRCQLLSASIEQAISEKLAPFVNDAAKVGQILDDLGGIGLLDVELVQRSVDSRFYVVAFVTDWGEESEPSPVSEMVEVDANDKVQITRPATMGGFNYAARNIAKWRIYRSNTSDSGAAWQLVAEPLITVTSYLDDKPSSELDALQPQFTWSEPPYRQDGQYEGWPKPVVGTNAYLRGLVGMPNGIMAGFLDNTVAFCEPYVPYAWPVEYQITTEHPIVGMAVFGQTLFVGTAGNPYFITGAHSASMSAEKIESNQSCASARSIVGVYGGVIYASPDGLCLASNSGVQVITLQHFTREDWQQLGPSTMMGAEHEGIYYLFYEGNGGGCLAFDLQAKKMGYVDLKASAVWVDRINDLMYVAKDGVVLECFAGTGKRQGRWRSSIAPTPAQKPIAWLKVYGEHSPAMPAVVRWYADGQLRHTATVTGLNPVRLPAGRWLEHEIEVQCEARISRVLLCSTTQELQAV